MKKNYVAGFDDLSFHAEFDSDAKEVKMSIPQSETRKSFLTFSLTSEEFRDLMVFMYQIAEEQKLLLHGDDKELRVQGVSVSSDPVNLRVQLNMQIALDGDKSLRSAVFPMPAFVANNLGEELLLTSAECMEDCLKIDLASAGHA